MRNWGDVAGVQYYFLSHYHYDHYQGLSKRWKHKIYCSPVTGRLVTRFLGVATSQIVELVVGEARLIGGVEVTGVEANHCPGSLMFVFRLTTGHTILHTGDFRYGKLLYSAGVFFCRFLKWLFV